MVPTLEDVKADLKDWLGRDVEIDRLKTGKFLCRYVEYGMSPLALVGETEEEALRKLHIYLRDKRQTRS